MTAFWIGLFVVVVILGAIAGGKSFGETIANGIGCIVIIVIIFFALAVLVVYFEQK